MLLSQPADPQEHEADRAADAIVNGVRPEPATRTGGAAELQRMPTEDEKLANALGLDSKGGHEAATPLPPSDEAGAEIATQLYGGRSLDERTRDLMESRFGESFSDVRIYTGHRAGDIAEQLNSRAFTVGEDIVFAAGEYAPGTTEGQRLLAHELAHVVQQRRTTGGLAEARHAEHDAGEAVQDLVRGGNPTVRARAEPGTVQKQPAEEWGFTRPASYVRGATVLVNDKPMANMSRAELMRKVGDTWDPAKRVYGVSVSVLSRLWPWTKYSTADAEARQDKLTVVITARSEFDHRTATVTIGAHAPPQPHPPAPPGPEPPGPEPDAQPDRPPATQTSSGDRVGRVERQAASDPNGALNSAASLSQRELGSLSPEPRKSLLQAQANAPSQSDGPQLARDLIATTPDQDAGAVSDALRADGGKLLTDLKRNDPDPDARAALDAAAQDLDSRRLDAPQPSTGRDYVDWTPELAKKAHEVRDALKKVGRRPPSLDENLSGRPEWDPMKARQDAMLQAELRNLDRDIASQIDPHGGLPTLAGEATSWIGVTAHDEVGKALERARAATTIKELFEARKAAKTALWRANQAIAAQRALNQFESAVASWNKTQSGVAAVASVPSHALAGVSFDRPDQIVAEARAGVERGLAQLRDAKTPEDMSRAATALKQTIADANYALSQHQDEVYVGGERTVTGIKVVALTSAAVVAPEYVIPGIFVGGGLGAARQGVQISEGSRQDFSGAEVFDSAVYGGFAAPFAVGIPAVPYVLSGAGIYNAAGEFSEGHRWTGAFDVGTAVLPFAVKRAPEIGRWARPRALALSLRVGQGAEDAGLSGRLLPPSIPNEPSAALVVDAAGRPIGRLTLDLGATPKSGVAPVEPASNAPSQTPSPWQTIQVGSALPAPYDLPVVVNVSPTPAGEEVFSQLAGELGTEAPGTTAVSRTRGRYADFQPIPAQAGQAAVVQQQSQRLAGQLNIPIPADRVLEAPWVGRVRSRAGEVSSRGTSQGWLRNEAAFWRAFRDQFPADYALLGPNRTVTPAFAQRYGWPTSGPDSVVGQPLVHHHIENGPLVVAIPESLHVRLSGTIHARPTVVASP
jgi:hypothetical protein